VAAWEGAGEGDVRERHELDAPRQLLWRERLGYERLEGNLEGRDRGDQEGNPGIALTAAQASDRQAERDAARDLGLPEDADGGREDVQRRRVQELDEIDHGAIDLA
jgi:hypothetical protein